MRFECFNETKKIPKQQSSWIFDGASLARCTEGLTWRTSDQDIQLAWLEIKSVHQVKRVVSREVAAEDLSVPRAEAAFVAVQCKGLAELRFNFDAG